MESHVEIVTSPAKVIASHHTGLFMPDWLNLAVAAQAFDPNIPPRLRGEYTGRSILRLVADIPAHPGS